MHTVLVVDDDQGVRDSISMQLRFSGYSALPANSGEAALDLLARESFKISVVITDLHMNGMNGVALARRVSENFPGIPVILCSGSGETTPEDFGLQTGLSAVLSKTVRRQQLIQVLFRLISG